MNSGATVFNNNTYNISVAMSHRLQEGPILSFLCLEYNEHINNSIDIVSTFIIMYSQVRQRNGVKPLDQLNAYSLLINLIN